MSLPKSSMLEELPREIFDRILDLGLPSTTLSDYIDGQALENVLLQYPTLRHCIKDWLLRGDHTNNKLVIDSLDQLSEIVSLLSWPERESIKSVRLELSESIADLRDLTKTVWYGLRPLRVLTELEKVEVVVSIGNDQIGQPLGPLANDYEFHRRLNAVFESCCRAIIDNRSDVFEPCCCGQEDNGDDLGEEARNKTSYPEDIAIIDSGLTQRILDRKRSNTPTPTSGKGYMDRFARDLRGRQEATAQLYQSHITFRNLGFEVREFHNELFGVSEPDAWAREQRAAGAPTRRATRLSEMPLSKPNVDARSKRAKLVRDPKSGKFRIASSAAAAATEPRPKSPPSPVKQSATTSTTPSEPPHPSTEQL